MIGDDDGTFLTYYLHPRQPSPKQRRNASRGNAADEAATRGPRWMTRHYLELRKIEADVPQNPGKNGLKLTSLLGSEKTSLP